MQTVPITNTLLDNWERLFVTAKEWGDILKRPLSLKYDAMLSLIDAARQNVKLIEAVDSVLAEVADGETFFDPLLENINALRAARGPKGVGK